jgi:hypothetical protein
MKWRKNGNIWRAGDGRRPNCGEERWSGARQLTFDCSYSHGHHREQRPLDTAPTFFCQTHGCWHLVFRSTWHSSSFQLQPVVRKMSISDASGHCQRQPSAFQSAHNAVGWSDENSIGFHWKEMSASPCYSCKNANTRTNC